MSVDILAYRSRQKQFLPTVRMLVTELLLAADQVTEHSVVTQPERVIQLTGMVVKAMDELIRYESKELQQYPEALQQNKLLKLASTSTRIRQGLLRIFSQPPAKAADLLVHSDLLEEMQRLTADLEQEINALEASHELHSMKRAA